MKFSLIKEINPKYSVLEQILTNRGIPHEELFAYTHTNPENLNSPLLLGEDRLKAGAKLLCEAIQKEQNILIIVDADCDGFTSSAVLINYLADSFPTWRAQHLQYFMHSGKQHGLGDCIDKILEEKTVSLVICPDASSNDYEEHKRLKENGIGCLVLDHHEAEYLSPNAVVVNNQMSNYPNKDLSGVGITWQFCRYIDSLLGTDYADKLIDLVALGNIADMMSLHSLETKYVIEEGLNCVTNPFIAAMAQKNSYSLKGKITPIGVAFYIAPFVNAMTRSGTQEEKELLFKSMLYEEAFTELPSTKRGHQEGETELLVDQAIRVAASVKNRQAKAQDAGVQFLEDMIEEQNLLSHKVLLFLLEQGEIDKNISGLIANKFMARFARPVCILTKVEKDGEVFYQGSARGCDQVGITNFKDICIETGVVDYAEGHQGAFGLSIAAEKIDDFIQKTDELLREMGDESVYRVDYIFNDFFKIKDETILDIADMEYYWGKDVEEPLIAIEGLRISAKDVTIYDKKGFTIKIQIPHTDFSLMLFKATEEDCQKLKPAGEIELSIVGKCNKNEWMGNISPQVFIQEYEITDSKEYIF